MLFEPTYRFDVLKEDEFSEKMNGIENELSKYAYKGVFSSFDNAPISYEYYKTQSPRGSVVIVHGYTEFAKKYHELTWYFLNMGFNVFLYDQRGHGYSYRKTSDMQLTHVESFEEYSSDLDFYINNTVIPESNGGDIYLYGHSMGGAIAILYLEKCKSSVKKAFLSAPMIYPTSAPLPHKILQFLMKKEAKKHGWEAKFKYALEFNPEAKIENSMDTSKARFLYNLSSRINDDHYRNSYSTNRWTYETLGLVETLLSPTLVKNISAEVVVANAGRDAVVRKSPQKRFAKMVNGKFISFPQAKHSLYTLRDKELREYLDHVFGFFIGK